MRSYPIKALFETQRNTVEPSKIVEDQVFHYSLPAWHETGDGQVDDPSDLASLKLLLQGGEILVSKLNPEKGAVIHAQGHVLPVIGSTEFIVLKPRLADGRFGYWLMQSAPIRFQLEASVESVTNSHKRARVDKFLASHVSVPDINTQKRIATFLDRETARIDGLIAKKERLSDVLLSQEENVLRRMISDCTAVPWRVRHLGKLKNGAGFPVELQGDAGNEIPFFKVKHLKTYGLDAEILNSDDTVSRDTARKLGATVFPSGTIVFAKIGAALLLARFSKIGVDACLDNNLSAFIPRKNIIIPDFAILAFSQIDMETMVQPGAVPSMNTESFYNYRIPLPDLAGQEAFVAEFRRFRNRLQATALKVRVSLDLLREYRAALITAAVTGQIDVDTYGKAGAPSATLDRIEEMTA